MSIDVGNRALRPEGDRGLALAGSGFIGLLILALFWPSPLLWMNEISVNAPLQLTESDFLGRGDSPWDVAFWAVAGLFALAVIHGRSDAMAESWPEMTEFTRSVPRRVRAAWRRLNGVAIAAILATVAGSICLVWWFADEPLVAFAEQIQSDSTRAAVRMFNRLGGGPNPVMVVLWFALAGLAFRRRHWVRLSIIMAISAAFAGLIVHLLKFTFGRTRPELWLGAFHHARESASSFPSGHTVAAFAIAGVLFFGSRSQGLRTLAMLVATSIAASRVMAFRHWPSDVLTSAVIGLLSGWFFVWSTDGGDEPKG